MEDKKECKNMPELNEKELAQVVGGLSIESLVESQKQKGFYCCECNLFLGEIITMPKGVSVRPCPVCNKLVNIYYIE